jgi:hypothetical protein
VQCGTAVARAGGLTDQVVAFGDVRDQPGGVRIQSGGSSQIAAELVQVAADGVPPVPVTEHLAQRSRAARRHRARARPRPRATARASTAARS